MKLSEILTEKKVRTVKTTSFPRNALVSRAMADIDSDSSINRQKFRNKVTYVIRNNQKLWSLDTGKFLYKMVTTKDIE